jgi:hypothetical protein
MCLHARNIHDLSLQENDARLMAQWTAESKERPKYLWLYYCFPVSVHGVTGNHHRDTEENGKVVHRTIANLSHASIDEVQAIKLALKHKHNLQELGNINEDH